VSGYKRVAGVGGIWFGTNVLKRMFFVPNKHKFGGKNYLFNGSWRQTS
jgi:hypothetical protein